MYNFEPPATHDEVAAAATQFVRKVSGFAKPSAANQTAFDNAVDDVAAAIDTFFAKLVTSAPSKDRDVEAAKARERATKRYG